MGIELRNVTKQVGADTHIHTTDLAFDKGGFNILLGTTLSGKTTLLRLMAGLERPTTGEVWFEGEDVSNVPVQKRSVAMVYQEFINYTNFSVFDNIASPLRVAGMPRREIRVRVEDIASLLKLTPLLNRLPAELSGGQQQRTALARALVKNAALVLLDSNLHPGIFDWSSKGSQGILQLNGGTLATTLAVAARYNARLTIYDAVQTQGLVWTHEGTTGCTGTRFILRVELAVDGIAA